MPITAVVYPSGPSDIDRDGADWPENVNCDVLTIYPGLSPFPDTTL